MEHARGPEPRVTKSIEKDPGHEPPFVRMRGLLLDDRGQRDDLLCAPTQLGLESLGASSVASQQLGEPRVRLLDERAYDVFGAAVDAKRVCGRKQVALGAGPGDSKLAEERCVRDSLQKRCLGADPRPL